MKFGKISHLGIIVPDVEKALTLLWMKQRSAA